jgi:hypothetical protein
MGEPSTEAAACVWELVRQGIIGPDAGYLSAPVIDAALEPLLQENQRLRDALKLIDKTLTIPAAEYVPAIGDVFKIIDAAGVK